jgi:hypothetical protein
MSWICVPGGSRPPANPFDANIGVIADELLQHLCELLRIVRKRRDLFCGELLGERAEQLGVVFRRRNVNLLCQRGNCERHVAARLRSTAHSQIRHIDWRKARRFDMREVLAGRQIVEDCLTPLVRGGGSRHASRGSNRNRRARHSEISRIADDKAQGSRTGRRRLRRHRRTCEQTQERKRQTPKTNNGSVQFVMEYEQQRRWFTVIRMDYFA